MSCRLTPNEAERLRFMVRNMTHDSAIYKLLRDELGALGHWKARPRGPKHPESNFVSREQRGNAIELGE